MNPGIEQQYLKKFIHPLKYWYWHKNSVKSLLEIILSHIPNTTYFQSGVTPGDQYGIYADNKLQKKLLKIDTFIQLEKGIEIFIKNLKLINNHF